MGEFENIPKLNYLYYAFPLTSVEPKRVYSHVNREITKLRNKLSINVWDQLLKVSRNSKVYREFDLK